MEKTAVVGMGTMGSQIGLVLARGVSTTIMYDLDQERVEWGLGNIEKILSRRVEKGKLVRSEMDGLLSRIETTTDMGRLKEVDMVVEAVFEDIALKREVFGELDRICSANTILATNTSTLCVSEIAAATQRPDRCIGTHFLIPAAFTP
ncbi:MAG: 3-hydroxybutyryl-CoA dehydrogenase, partial [Proteobacteria bacterium]|nr:3-hydroxybutyryl-CoA dehydrogenase [Pseudomonadota bacterium]